MAREGIDGFSSGVTGMSPCGGSELLLAIEQIAGFGHNGLKIAPMSHGAEDVLEFIDGLCLG